jgi:hypothetical protein
VRSEYLAPGLEHQPGDRRADAQQPAFDGLIVNGAKTMQASPCRSNELTQLISNTSTRPAQSLVRAPRWSRR